MNNYILPAAFFLISIFYTKTYLSKIVSTSLASKTILNDTINAEKFGVVADYNKQYGTDNTKSLQQAIDYASSHNCILKLPEGKILLNSHGNNKADIAHGNILQLRSNLTIIGNKTEIYIGDFFDDKGFIVLSGFNSPWVENFSKLQNITLKGFTIDFQSNSSYMKTKYSLRKGIEFGHSTNVLVDGLIFRNGDITCAIATGYGNKRISQNVKITNCTFTNLVSSQKNLDHSTLYINSANSTISNNRFFMNNPQARLMACAVEFHNSKNNFLHNTVYGYTRMMYLAAINSENQQISDIRVENNNANITNAAIYLWLDDNTTMNNILIKSNEIVCSHMAGYSMLYNGTQGVLSDARESSNTKISNMQITDNKIQINKTIFKGRAVKYNTRYKFKDYNNVCRGCIDGNNAIVN